LVAFPFDSDRFRLGHLYAISVGGTTTYPRTSWIGAPGAKLVLKLGPGSYFVGAKTVPSETVASETGPDATGGYAPETTYSVLGGAGWSLVDDTLQLDVGAGYFSQGENPIHDVAGAAVYAVGGSGRIVFHRGLPVEESIDLTLYRNDPNRPFLYFRPVKYFPGEIGWLVSLEAIALAQRLADPKQFGALMFQPAIAGALQARLQHGMWRHEVTVLYEDLPFLLHTVPSFVAFQGFPQDARRAPEVMAACATDYHFEASRLTLGAAAGVMWPASVETSITGTIMGDPTPVSLGDYAIVVTGSGPPSLLPEGESARPIVHARVQARFDLSEMLFAVAWFQFRYDPNSTTLTLSPDLTRARVFGRAAQYGVGASAAVRF
jgi:hypothetical protein